MMSGVRVGVHAVVCQPPKQYDANGNLTRRLAIGADDPDADTDADGMPDLKELLYFGNLDQGPGADPDGDGLANGTELALDGDPTKVDTDGDGASDRDEYLAGTGLNDPASYLHLVAVSNRPPWAVEFASSTSRWYSLEAQTNFTADAWTTVPGLTNIPGQPGTTLLTDPRPAVPVRFYRVKVQPPP